MKKVFITGVSSDIGTYLAERCIQDGCTVYGTFRTKLSNDVRKKIKMSGGECYSCDFSSKYDINNLIRICWENKIRWDLLISSVGSLEPIGKFKDVSFDEWEQSIYVNAISQLRFLHGIYELQKENPTVIFFAGGGTNNAFPNYSAYCISKILLMKMCELLDEEDKRINIVIAGPGMIGTKIHTQTIMHQEMAGDNYTKTINFLEAEGDGYGKNMERIYEFIHWAVKRGRDICGGRNFSIVHDEWDKDSILINELLQDTNMYKLRRYKN